MKNWRIGLTGGIAISVLLVACGGNDTVKKASVKSLPSRGAASVESDATRVSSNSSSGRFIGAAQAHNSIRNKHNLPPLVWSDSLASYAQEWANQLAGSKNCQIEHRPNGGTFKQLHGENLYWAGATTWSDGRREAQGVSVNDVVAAWASEEKDYDYASNTCKSGKQCGHYTQVVWKDTTEVGCGFKQCSDKSQLWVCNYNTAGNYVGQKPY